MEVKESSDSSLSNQRLLGRVALVTGDASCIGESIVRLFHKHGVQLCIADIQDELGQRVCESLGDEQNKFGTLDIIVNNAGLIGLPYSDIREYELSVFNNVLDVNVKGLFLGMKHVIAGLGPHADTAAKLAVLGLTLNVAAEMGKHGIRVNCVSPYTIATGLCLSHLPTDQRKNDAIDDFNSYFGQFANLQGMDLVAWDVANAVLFLASDEAKYISGHNLMIDGSFSSVNHSLKVFK
ncbi:unnamed protein product [Withania somnifera]